MADPILSRDADALTRRAYTLAPVRSVRFRIAAWALVCALSALAGGAAVVIGEARRAGGPLTQCLPAAVDRSAEQIELARARLALAQELAARAAVQKAADSAAADVARLNDELQFLRGQKRTAPIMRTHPQTHAQTATTRR
ncbi:hypothetical protein LMG28727_03385 [Paraburkholderia kirstenboschensis]|uniref:hypothetical protein n=1 Tax=Paraburkholderia kirstenboschensis TaxID=1245436 RepID=UPI000A901B41|nr:hypothetical protein [Paraburkholderia kirstenboschensis]CAD6536789.1 hypothetical protein LMG28727_03385 [Paraburkholderia kirstenboschensis]